jgi:hypothetical protein
VLDEQIASLAQEIDRVKKGRAALAMQVRAAQARQLVRFWGTALVTGAGSLAALFGGALGAGFLLNHGRQGGINDVSVPAALLGLLILLGYEALAVPVMLYAGHLGLLDWRDLLSGARGAGCLWALAGLAGLAAAVVTGRGLICPGAVFAGHLAFCSMVARRQHEAGVGEFGRIRGDVDPLLEGLKLQLKELQRQRRSMLTQLSRVPGD